MLFIIPKILGPREYLKQQHEKSVSVSNNNDNMRHKYTSLSYIDINALKITETIHRHTISHFNTSDSSWNYHQKLVHYQRNIN